MNSVINAFNEHCREILMDMIKKNTLNMFREMDHNNFEKYTKKNKELSKLWLTLYANIL